MVHVQAGGNGTDAAVQALGEGEGERGEARPAEPSTSHATAALPDVALTFPSPLNSRTRAAADIEYVEPDYKVWIVGATTPNDPYYDQQWHLPLISAPAAWAVSTGTQGLASVCIIDTGVDMRWPGCAQALCCVPVAAAAFDGVQSDCAHHHHNCTAAALLCSAARRRCRGWFRRPRPLLHCPAPHLPAHRSHPDIVPNLVAGFDAIEDDSDVSDGNGHGTHVAGLVGAAGNNGVGVVGVNWQVRRRGQGEGAVCAGWRGWTAGNCLSYRAGLQLL